MTLVGLSDTFVAAIRTLRVNKLRSVLTLLGIVIGVVAVVAMAATIEGLRRKITSDLEQLGSGVFQVQKQPQGGFGDGDRAKYEKRKDFTLSDVDLLQMRCGSCLLVGGEAWEFGRDLTAHGRPLQSMVAIAGATAAFFDNNGYALAAGRLFGEGEARSGLPVVVIGADVADIAFPNESAVGNTLVVRGQPLRVIGTLGRRGQQLEGSIDNVVVMPIGRFFPLYGSRRSLNVTIQARDPDRLGRTQDEVVQLLRQARGVAPEADNDFEMFSNASVQDTFNNLTSIVAAASVGICAIALLIGGIGVMNIMLVSVSERTSEIGLRRALGARRRRILAQFLVEAVLLTAIGGATGIAIGAGIAELIEILVHVPTAVPMWAVVLSMIAAGGVGLVFGIYPAFRASRLDPIEAMRRE